MSLPYAVPIVPPPAPVRRSSTGRFCVLISFTALLVSLGALALAAFRDPLGAGLKKYDFSTPKAAMVSHARMQINGDVRALVELQQRTEGRKVKEMLDTLDVRKEVEHRGRKLLFVTYKKDGVSKYEVAGFEKDAATGFWLPRSTYGFDVEKDDKDLAEQMRRWKDGGTLSAK